MAGVQAGVQVQAHCREELTDRVHKRTVRGEYVDVSTCHRRLAGSYEYWQQHSSFPCPPTQVKSLLTTAQNSQVGPLAMRIPITTTTTITCRVGPKGQA